MPVRILTGVKVAMEGVTWTRLVTTMAAPVTVETGKSVPVVGRCFCFCRSEVTVTSELSPGMREVALGLTDGGPIVPPVVVGQGMLLGIDTWLPLQVF